MYIVGCKFKSLFFPVFWLRIMGSKKIHHHWDVGKCSSSMAHWIISVYKWHTLKSQSLDSSSEFGGTSTLIGPRILYKTISPANGNCWNLNPKLYENSPALPGNSPALPGNSPALPGICTIHCNLFVGKHETYRDDLSSLLIVITV